MWRGLHQNQRPKRATRDGPHASITWVPSAVSMIFCPRESRHIRTKSIRSRMGIRWAVVAEWPREDPILHRREPR